MSGGSFGKGSTAEQGEASALMEAIERYSGIFQGDEIRMTRRFTDFPSGEAIAPNKVLLFSDTQYRRGQMATIAPDASKSRPHSIHRPRSNGRRSGRCATNASNTSDRPVVFFLSVALPAHPADSNGCAAGNTLEEAIVQGFLELVERDAYAIWWYNRLQRAEVDLGQFDDSYIRDLQSQFAETGRRLWVLDVTSDLGIPSFVAVAHAMDNGRENIEFGSGAHFDMRIALLRALTELNQFLSIGLMGGRRGGQVEQ